MYKACELFQGEHNFDSFRNRHSNNNGQEQLVNPIKFMEVSSMSKIPDHAFEYLDPAYKHVDMYEFRFKSRSFMYRQVNNLQFNLIYN